MNIFNSLLEQLVKYDVHTTRKIQINTRYFLSHIIILWFPDLCTLLIKVSKGVALTALGNFKNC